MRFRQLAFGVMTTTFCLAGVPALATETACRGAPATEAALDHPFVLKYGQAATLPGTGLTLTFDDFTDSRCPAGVTCIRMGQAKVRLTASQPPRPPRQLDLGIFHDRHAIYDGYDIKLSELSPYPEPRVTVPPQAHCITLDVKAIGQESA